MAIAPTTSSSFILGQVSPSIEPLQSNYFTKDLAKGKFTYKNPYLKELLAEKDMDTQEIWRQIMLSGGSVQGLDFLSQEEKDIFKTFGEISQMEVIQQSADRQKYIDQGISVNTSYNPVFFEDEKIPMSVLLQHLLMFYKYGGKQLYYFNTFDGQGELDINVLNSMDKNEEVSEEPLAYGTLIDDEDCEGCTI